MNSLRMSFWIVPESFCVRHALLLGGDDVERQHRQHRAVHGHRHAHLVERDAGEQRAHVVDRSRSRRPPCRRRRRRADDRSRSRGGWRDRRRWRGPSGRRRGCAGRRRWNPPPWRSRHIAGWSRAASRTSWGRGRAGTAACRDRCRGNRGRRDRLRRRPASPRCLRASCQGVERCRCRPQPARRRTRRWRNSGSAHDTAPDYHARRARSQARRSPHKCKFSRRPAARRSRARPAGRRDERSRRPPSALRAASAASAS